MRTRKAAGRRLAIIAMLFTVSACASAQHMDHHGPAEAGSISEEQEWAKKQLAKSPRHQEWVKIKYKPAGGATEREVSAFIVFPEVKKKALAVVVIHEINGMTDWVQSLTDQVAEAGYIGIAPDLLSGMGANGGGTSSYPDREAVGKAIRDLSPDQITADLNAVANYVANLPAANGKVGVAGFCWGGAQTFRYATNNPKIESAFVFYGSPPTTSDQKTIDNAALARIKAPVYGFYGGNDMRINATLPATIAAMKEAGKKFEPVTYEGAGHGFMRAGDAPEPKASASTGDKAADEKAAAEFQKELTTYKANKKARDEAWVRWKVILASI